LIGITFTLLAPTEAIPIPLFVTAAIVPEQAVPCLSFSGSTNSPFEGKLVTALNGVTMLPIKSSCDTSLPPSNTATFVGALFEGIESQAKSASMSLSVICFKNH